MIHLFLLFLVAVWSDIEAAQHTVTKGVQNSSVTVDLAEEHVSIGENIIISITLKYPQGYTPDIKGIAKALVDYAGPMTPPFRLISSEVTPTQESQTTRVDFVLAPQRIGTFFLPLKTIVLIPNDPKKNEAIEIIPDIFAVEIVKATKPAEFPKDPTALMAPQFPIGAPYALAGMPPINTTIAHDIVAWNKSAVLSRSFPWFFLLGCIILLGVFWLMRYGGIRDLKRAPEKEDPETVRRRALYDLKHIVTEGMERTEVSSIDSVVRNYFEQAHEIPASHQTSQEFLGDMVQTHQFDAETVHKMAGLYHQIDVLKYSQAKIPVEQAQKLATIATQIITTLDKK